MCNAEGNIVGCIEYVQDITKERIAVDRMTAVAAELVKASEELSCGRRQRGNDWLFLLLRRVEDVRTYLIESSADFSIYIPEKERVSYSDTLVVADDHR